MFSSNHSICHLFCLKNLKLHNLLKIKYVKGFSENYFFILLRSLKKRLAAASEFVNKFMQCYESLVIIVYFLLLHLVSIGLRSSDHQETVFYIIPIPPAGIAGAAGASSLISVMPASVVKSIPATLAAF